MLTPEQSKQIGHAVVDDGRSETRALAEARARGVQASRADIHRAAYERAKAVNPFAAAHYGLANQALYNDGSATSSPTNAALNAVRDLAVTRSPTAVAAQSKPKPNIRAAMVSVGGFTEAEIVAAELEEATK